MMVWVEHNWESITEAYKNIPVLPIPKAAEVQNRNTYISSLSQGECSGVKNIPGARVT